MNPLSSKFDRMRIATPCPVSWDQMTGDNRVRFCDHCQLNVYNISELSRTEAESLIASTEGRLCARLYRRADGTVLTRDCPVGLRALRRRVSNRVAAMFAAIVGLSTTALGQQQASTDKQPSCPSETKITQKKAPDNSPSAVTGTALDPNGATIPGAQVLLINVANKETRTTLATDAGRFEFTSVAPGLYEVQIVSLPFASDRVIRITVESNQIVNVDTYVQLVGEPLSGIVSIDYPKIEQRKPGTTIIDQEMIKRLPINW